MRGHLWGKAGHFISFHSDYSRFTLVIICIRFKFLDYFDDRYQAWHCDKDLELKSDHREL